MNTQKQDGGPAFPKTVDGTRQQQDGMSLRDYFAAAALQGLMAQPDERIYRGDPSGVDAWRSEIAKQDAACAYKHADAMIQQRGEA